MDKKTVVITGATAGIGRATALRSAREGYRVAAYGRNQSALDALRPELGPEGIAERLDVRDADAWRTRIEELAGVSGGRLDVLVNNAGVLSAGPFARIPRRSTPSHWLCECGSASEVGHARPALAPDGSLAERDV